MAKFFICGDIIHNNENISFIGDNLSQIIRDSDFSIGNLEGCELAPQSSIPNAPFQSFGTIHYLGSVGFNMMLLANNHVSELGANALEYTINTIKNEGMHHIGAGFSWEETYKPIITVVKGLKFAFLNVCEAQEGQMLSSEQSFGYAWMGYDKIFEDISALAQNVDYVVVFVHAGLEHYPLPIPEIRAFYKRLCDAGASAVIGGHPHIVQGYEYYKDSFIAYSLGNFYFPHESGIRENENTAFSLILEFTNEGNIIPTPVHHSLKHSIVDIETDVQNQHSVSKLCGMLNENYEQLAIDVCIQAYQTLCRKLLVQSLCGDDEKMSIISLIKDIIRRSFFRNKYVYSTKAYRDKLLLRLFENETYRYTIIRALKSLNK